MKVSIITVCFNSADTIRDTIESVTAQDYKDVEYIVIDGGSTDDTLEIINEYADSVSHLISESDKGIYDAMNKGIAAATGDVAGFLNADDFFASNDVVKRIADSFVRDSLDVCYGDLLYVDRTDTDRIVRVWKSREFDLQLLSRGWIPAHPTFYAKRELLAVGFDLKYQIAADYDLMLGVLNQNGLVVGYLSSVLVKMRSGGMSNGSWRDIVKQNLEILEAAKKRGIPMPPIRWLGRKLFDRLGQRFKARTTSD
jgi:glycosyltransferase involved in cell wall biosynthesis